MQVHQHADTRRNRSRAGFQAQQKCVEPQRYSRMRRSDLDPKRASEITMTCTAYAAAVWSVIYHAVISVRLWGLYCSVASTC